MLRNISEVPTDAAEPPSVALVRVFVQSQLGDHQVSVRQLVDQAGCSADYLSHPFDSASGEHLVPYINRQRMERATKLLRESTLS